ncbi:prepilin-type N-terminal cleavage/methylation domain-containing protein [Litoribrevibacter euphylliae]|uniref:Prepilin-type N-terminal cleavage/methylation domain-containing protein n=1 Tax=Litoribrevibacter euphylliae TaxID=1834034 RepID=A0ABV7HID1_9GAMM
MLRKGGFTLIELMISLLLISITLLGSARLQLVAQQQIERAYYTGQALALIEEASRRVSLNYKQRSFYLVSDLSLVQEINCNPCSPSDLVQLDLTHLSQNLQMLFPSGKARIHRCNSNLCMSVAWLGESFERCDQVLTCIDRQIL